MLAALLVLLAALPAAAAEPPTLTLASTTRTQQSGFFDYLLPRYRQLTGVQVNVVTSTTGQAVRLAGEGTIDLLLLHDDEAEHAVIAAGLAIERRAVMHGDFILVGPTDDPAGIAGGSDPVAAVRKLANMRLPFLSRGDGSAADRAERRLWQAAGLDPRQSGGGWYEQNPDQELLFDIAAKRGAYLLVDRIGWLAFPRSPALRILLTGDAALTDRYAVLLVNPARFPLVKATRARRFIAWLSSSAGRHAIDGFRIGGQQIFVPEGRAVHPLR